MWNLIAIAVGVVSQACGLQLGGALHRTDGPSDTSGSLQLSGKLHRARVSGPYGAWSTTMTFARAERTSVRSVAFGAGYRLVAMPYLRFELGPELGMGMPATLRYAHTALFAGGTVGALFRIPVLGDQDNMIGFAPVGSALDFVVMGRAGRWIPSLGDSGAAVWETGAELGLRFTFFSDLLVSEHDGWEGSWESP